jgi:hypothetical protein
MAKDTFSNKKIDSMPQGRIHKLEASVPKLPFSFKMNQGQTEPQVKFLARSGQVQLFLTPQEVVFNLPNATAPVRLRFGGANPAPEVIGEQPLNAVVICR